MSAIKPIQLPANLWSKTFRRCRDQLGILGFEIVVWKQPIIRNPGNGQSCQVSYSVFANVRHQKHGEVLPAATEGEIDAFVTGLFLPLQK